MSAQDPISDMLTRIRNAQQAGKAVVSMPSSKKLVAIAKVLENEGFIGGFEVISVGAFKNLHIQLKYLLEDKIRIPVIELIQRKSRPGLREYRKANELPKVKGGLGVAVISTSKGLLSDRVARSMGHGGEVLFTVA